MNVLKEENIWTKRNIQMLLNLWSEMRFSAFEEELARDSDNTFNLSTCREMFTYEVYERMVLPAKD